jgi:hypothetical protein
VVRLICWCVMNDCDPKPPGKSWIMVNPGVNPGMNPGVNPGMNPGVNLGRGRKKASEFGVNSE